MRDPRTAQRSLLLCALALCAGRVRADERLAVLPVASIGTFDGLAGGLTFRGKHAALIATVGVTPSMVFHQRPNDHPWDLRVVVRADPTLTLGGSVKMLTERKYTASLLFGGRWHGLWGPGVFLGVERRSQLSKRVHLLMYGGASTFPSASEGLKRIFEPGTRVFPLGPFFGVGGNFAFEFSMF